MWCTNCHNGHANYRSKVCGYCYHTKMTDKDVFAQARKNYNKKKPKQTSKREYHASVTEDVEDIVAGRVKPTVMK